MTGWDESPTFMGCLRLLNEAVLTWEHREPVPGGGGHKLKTNCSWSHLCHPSSTPETVTSFSPALHTDVGRSEHPETPVQIRTSDTSGPTTHLQVSHGCCSGANQQWSSHSGTTLSAAHIPRVCDCMTITCHNRNRNQSDREGILQRKVCGWRERNRKKGGQEEIECKHKHKTLKL